MPKPFWRYFGPRRDWFRTAFYNDKRVNWVSQIPQDPDGDGNTDRVARFDGFGLLVVSYSKGSERTADFTGTGTLDMAVNFSAVRTADFTGTGTFEADGDKQVVRISGFTGVGTFDIVDYAKTGARTADFTGVGTFDALGYRDVPRTAGFTGTGTFDATYGTGSSRAADFTGTGTFDLSPSEFGTTGFWFGQGDWSLSNDINRAATFTGTGDFVANYGQSVSGESLFAMEIGGAATPFLEDSPPAGVSGMIAWFDPSIRTTHYWDTAATMPINNGDLLGYVEDISGNGNDLHQSGDGYWVERGINGLGSWDFPSFAGYPLANAVDWPEADDLTEMTWFIVCQGGFDFQADLALFKTVEYNFSGGLLEVTDGGYVWSTSTLLDLGATFNSKPRLITATWDFVSSEAILRDSGAEIDSSTHSDITPLGDFTSCLLGLQAGLTGEIIIFDSVLSAGNIAAIEEYLIDKWIPDITIDVPQWQGVGDWNCNITFTGSGSGGGEASAGLVGTGGWNLDADLENETSADWTWETTSTDPVTFTYYDDFDGGPGGVTGVVLWLDANDTSTVLQIGGSPVDSEGQAVETWEDKGPYGYDFQQLDDDYQPTWTRQGNPSGPGYLFFDGGIEDYLSRGAAANLSLTEMTVCVAYEVFGGFGGTWFYGGSMLSMVTSEGDGSVNMNWANFDIDGPGGTPPAAGITFNAKDDLGALSQSARDIDWLPAQTKGWGFGYINASDDLLLETNEGFGGPQNRPADATAITNSLNMVGGFNGNAGTGSTLGYFGYIGEIVVYDHSLTAGERSALKSYFNAKWL